jgi:outer membrane protein TolC
VYDTLVVPSVLPVLSITSAEAYAYAYNNYVKLLNEQKILEASQQVIQAKKNSGFGGNISASYGINSSSNVITDVYQDFQSRQGLTFSFQLPILDWNQARINTQISQSQYNITEKTIEKQKYEFERQLTSEIYKLNLIYKRISLIAKTDSLAELQSKDIQYQYLLGRKSIIDLNQSIQQRDTIHQSNLELLRDFWNQIYTLRYLTLYDFVENKSLLN